MLIAKWSMTTLLAMFIFMDREEVKTLLYFFNIEIDIYLMDWDALKTLIYISVPGLMPLLPSLRPSEEDVKWETVLPHSCVDPTR